MIAKANNYENNLKNNTIRKLRRVRRAAKKKKGNGVTKTNEMIICHGSVKCG